MRASLALIAGVWLGPRFAAPFWLWAGAAAFVGLACLPRHGLAGRRGLLLAVCVGGMVWSAQPAGPSLEGRVWVQGVRSGTPVGSTADLAVERVLTEGQWKPSSGKVRVRFRRGEVPDRGTRILLHGWAHARPDRVLPGEPDPVRAARLERINTFVSAVRVGEVGVAKSEPPSIEDRNGLLRAVALGDRSGVAREHTALLRTTGTSHLLAISGFHVGVVAMSAVVLGGFLRKSLAAFVPAGIPAGMEWVIGVAMAFAYTAAAGAPVSAQRAALLFAWMAVGRARGRQVDVLPMLAMCGAILVVMEPGHMATAAFQLSFGAVAGMILWVPRIKSRLPDNLPGPLQGLVDSLAATLAATIGTMPAAAWWFQSLSPTSPAANLLAMPIMAWMVVPAAAAACFAPEPIASLGSWLGGYAGDLFLAVLSPFDYPVWTPAVGPWGAALLAIAVVWPRLPIALAGVMVTVGWKVGLPGTTLTMLDVGQGESLFLANHDGTHHLIDGGPPGNDVLYWLRREGIRKLDRVSATHAERDHIGGLVPVLTHLDVEVLSLPGIEGFEELIALAQAQGTRLDLYPDDALHPKLGVRYDTANNGSLVYRVGPPGSEVLLTGDIEESAEQVLSPTLAHAPILKVAHHGSKTSTTDELLDAVTPALALISVGRANYYGHPSEPVLDRLESRGIEVLRTDTLGTIQLELHSTGFTAHHWLPGEGWVEL